MENQKLRNHEHIFVNKFLGFHVERDWTCMNLCLVLEKKTWNLFKSMWAISSFPSSPEIGWKTGVLLGASIHIHRGNVSNSYGGFHIFGMTRPEEVLINHLSSWVRLHEPGTLNNQFYMDVSWNNHFPCKRFGSSSNLKLLICGFRFQAHLIYHFKAGVEELTWVERILHICADEIYIHSEIASLKRKNITCVISYISMITY